MVDTHEQLSSYLLSKYGPQLGIAEVAESLHLSPATLRVAIHSRRHRHIDYVARLRATKRRLGRRVYWLATDIAALLSERNAA